MSYLIYHAKLKNEVNEHQVERKYLSILIYAYLSKLTYTYLYFGSLKMTEVLKTTQLERNLFEIENKITRYSHHRIFLEKYENNQKYPKGLSLKFNLSLCSN